MRVNSIRCLANKSRQSSMAEYSTAFAMVTTLARRLRGLRRYRRRVSTITHRSGSRLVPRKTPLLWWMWTPRISNSTITDSRPPVTDAAVDGRAPHPVAANSLTHTMTEKPWSRSAATADSRPSSTATRTAALRTAAPAALSQCHPPRAEVLAVGGPQPHIVECVLDISQDEALVGSDRGHEGCQALTSHKSLLYPRC